MEEKISVSKWSCQNVSMWLHEGGFGDYSSAFYDENINGAALLSLTENDLCEVVNKLGDRKNLVININRLRRQNPHCTEKVLGHRTYNTSSLQYWEINQGSPDRFPRNSLSNGSSPRSSVNDDELTDTVFEPEYKKLFLSYVYVSCVFLVSAFVMVEVHDRVPDIEKYPPLPDIVLDNLPYMPWAFKASELCGITLTSILCIIIFFHKHRFIVLRRIFAITGTVFLLRCITMLATSLSVPDHRLGCAGKMYGDMHKKAWRALEICSGFGMTLTGVRTCGDYMFSGHTIVLTMANHFITEYSPHHWYFLHTVSWILNIFGTFFILAAHEHYSIDVIIAFYITSRLFLYYHSLANNRAHKQKDRRIEVWFPMFTYFEAKMEGPVPNEYCWPELVLNRKENVHDKYD